MSVQVKICGLSEPETLRVAVSAGADWIGFVFVEKSPRFVTLAAAETLLFGMSGATPVALLVDPDDDLVHAVGQIGFPVIQLHGAETPERTAAIKQLSGAEEVWKAVGVAKSADIERAEAYLGYADRLLLDAKPTSDGSLTGGAGEVFDWSLLKDWAAPMPWILAGGLSPENVGEAIRGTGTHAVDVSSGVERARGLKDAERIEAFIKAAKASDEQAE